MEPYGTVQQDLWVGVGLNDTGGIERCFKPTESMAVGVAVMSHQLFWYDELHWGSAMKGGEPDKESVKFVSQFQLGCSFSAWQTCQSRAKG